MIRGLFTLALGIAILALSLNNRSHHLTPLLWVLLMVQACNIVAYLGARRRRSRAPAAGR